MSNYPPGPLGFKIGEPVEIEFKCPNCGTVWVALCRRDIGFSVSCDDNAFTCPACGEEVDPSEGEQSW